MDHLKGVDVNILETQRELIGIPTQSIKYMKWEKEKYQLTVYINDKKETIITGNMDGIVARRWMENVQ